MTNNRIIANLLLSMFFWLPISASAQHALQLDDGAGNYYMIKGLGIGGDYILPPGGGTLLTSLGGGVPWFTLGNTLTGLGPLTPNEFLGSANNYDVVIKANGIEQFRFHSSGGVELPPTVSSGSGVIFQNGITLIHTAGTNNFFSGPGAGNFLSAGTSNTGIGLQVLSSNTSGSQNTGVGVNSLIANTTGNENTGVGVFALHANKGGGLNTAVGMQALYQNIGGSANTAVGAGALLSNSNGGNNTAVGYSTLANSTVNNLTAVGYEALTNNTSGTLNTAVGYEAMRQNTTGGNNSAFGFSALSTNTTGGENTAVGWQALENNTTASFNSALGYSALFANTTGSFNAAVGISSLTSNTSGNSNSAYGSSALAQNTTGDNNTALGTSTLFNGTSGSNNSAFGFAAGNTVSTGSNNTFCGAGSDVSGGIVTNASSIGYQAIACASNTMVFGNSSVIGWGFGTCPLAGNAIQVGFNNTNGNGATLTVGGAWTNGSSRNFKERFEVLSGAGILSKIVALNVLGWYYKGTNEYHIGPIAEDFFSTFNTGNQDTPSQTQKYISSVDPAGVALIGIQELAKEFRTLQQENAALKAEVESIHRMLGKAKKKLSEE